MYIYSIAKHAMFTVHNYVTFCLAETRKRQKQEMNVLTMEQLQEKYRRKEEELRRTQAECVLCGLKSIDIRSDVHVR